jgi:hypothetical protein
LNCICQDGFYDDSVNANCQNCNYKCSTCSNSNTCLTCKGSNRIKNTTSGECECLIGYFDDGVNADCAQCNVKCSSCSISSTNCDSCNTSDPFRDNTTPICGCLDSHFLNPNDTCEGNQNSIKYFTF